MNSMVIHQHQYETIAIEFVDSPIKDGDVPFFSMTRGAFPKSSELNQNTGGRAMRRPFRASWTALKARPSSRGLGWGLVGFQGLEALDFREVLGDLMSSRNFYGQALVSPGNK